MPISYSTNSPEYLSTADGKRFDTYRGYLKSIYDFFYQEYSALPNFIKYCNKTISPIRPLKYSNVNEIKNFLHIAWNTEYLLSINHNDPEIIRINNQWTPIQAYYSVYSGLEALSYGINTTHPYSHQKALQQCSSFLIDLGISPWDKAYKGSIGKKRSSQTPVHFPSGLDIPHNLQRHNVKPIEMIAKCLKVEHAHRVDDKWTNRKKNGKYKYQYDPKPTTILHFLYRLRVKSNYDEIDMFVMKAPRDKIVEFANSLKEVTSWTLSLIEMILIKRLGASPIQKQMESYLDVNKHAHLLKYRLSEYSNLNW